MIPKRWHAEVLRLARDALRAGAERAGPITVSWSLVGQTGCHSPHVTEVRARPSRTNDDKWIVVGRGRAAPVYVYIETPCRRCEACLRHRARLWTARGLSEGRAASRTWLGTLTLSPDAQYVALAAARSAYKGGDFDELPPDHQLRLRDRQIAPEIQKFLKRVRAQSRAPLRYLCVCEAHQSGAPHYHVLVHEGHPDHPVRKAILKSQWRLGFSDWRLVADDAQIAYTCKYIAKSMGARVRASIDYGSPPVVIAPGQIGGVKNLTPPRSSTGEPVLRAE